ncbi:MAG: hypothetical protein KDK53_09910 [Maritimibacter sp.]|nr:hypothetical protein [Maritimibacter sp.]
MSCHLIETANAAAKAVAPGAILPDPAREALLAALADETQAAETCAGRIAVFGDVSPFAKHLKAKRRRVAALATLARAYGIAVPKGPRASGQAPATGLEATREAACIAGIAAETARLARYQAALIPAAADAPALAGLFDALTARTRDRHLPALRRALSETTGIPDLHGHHGHGHGHRHGPGGCGSGGCGHAPQH